jgi:hypothetical protein
MKKISLFFIAAAFTACNNSTDTKVESMSATTDSSKQDNMTYPYTAMYSSKFEMGDAKNAQTILNIWKSWDNGDLTSMKEMFADSLEFHFSNGMTDKGSRDSVMAHAQAFRNTMDSVSSTVDAFFPVKSTDKNENWVCIWGKEVDKDKKGKIDSTYLQETWRLNKDGKVDFVLQYKRDAMPPKMGKM